MKICTLCQQNKAIINFRISGTSKDGLRYYCITCEDIQNRKRYLENKSKQYNYDIKTKRCSLCGKNKKITSFYFHGDGCIRSQCKECTNKVATAKQNKRLQTLEGKFARWKVKAKSRNLEWNLDLEYLSNMKMVCFYTGIPITFELHQLNTISLDRIDSSLGYTKGNVVLCCQIVNKMKSNLITSKFVELCELVVKNKHNINLN